MTEFFILVVGSLRAFLQRDADLLLENLALRHQLQVVLRSKPRPRLRNRDRILWVWIRRFCPGSWKRHLVVVRPETVISWHRRGWRLYWTWRSRARFGRPRLTLEVRALIGRMAFENPTWGTQRIRGELLKLGIAVSARSIRRYRIGTSNRPPSQTWLTFLAKQAKVSASQAKPTRTLLNMLFGYALRHDALARNPVEGTSQLRRGKATPQALTIDQIAAIREAAVTWRSEPGLPGPKPDGQVRDIIEVLLGTALRPGEVLALRSCDIEDLPAGMIASVNGTVIQRKGSGAERQPRPKTDASVRRIAVPEFAAVVLRRRLGAPGDADRERTVFASRTGGPLSPYNVRRTFRDFLKLADLSDSAIGLRWYRRTGATVIARGMGSDAAATFLGHSSTAITEGHYIERDRTVDPTPAAHLERTLRPGPAATRPPWRGSSTLSARSVARRLPTCPAQHHVAGYRRILMMIYDEAHGRHVTLDLRKSNVRNHVRTVTTTAHLQSLFEARR